MFEILDDKLKFVEVIVDQKDENGRGQRLRSFTYYCYIAEEDHRPCRIEDSRLDERTGCYSNFLLPELR